MASRSIGYQERAEIVRQKLEAAKDHIYMAHALRRISYATCDPENLQFAFLAREPKAQPNTQYCHAFVTAVPEAAEELNAIMGEVFRLAYAQQRLAALTAANNGMVQSKPANELATVTQGGTSQQMDGDGQVSLTKQNEDSVCTSTSQHLATSNSLTEAQVIMINKPLPPLPDQQSVTIHPNLADSASTHESSAVAPTVVTTATTNTTSSSTDVATDERNTGEIRQTNGKHAHKVHKHHKPHKHHRHKNRNSTVVPPSASTQTCEDCDRGLSHQHDVPNDPPTSPARMSFHDTTAMCEPPSIVCPPRLGDSSNIPKTDQVPLHEYDLTEPPHFYDMAEHQSCGIVGGKHLTTPQNTTDLIPNATTTSSSTTGCSTATSGSGFFGSGSDDSSFKRRLHDHQQRCGCSHMMDSQICNPPTSPPLTPHFSPQGRTVSSDTYPSEVVYEPWYQPDLPRDKALEMLAKQSAGSFVIRDSRTHANCYALSVQSGESISNRSKQCNLHSKSGVATKSFYLTSFTSISHFLIQRTSDGGVKLKGLEKVWPSLSCLVLHLTVIPEMLPCPLRLPRASANPAFSPVDPSSDMINPCGLTRFEQAPSAVQFHSLCDSVSLDEALAQLGQADEDYQRLSDFSSMLADLKLRQSNKDG